MSRAALIKQSDLKRMATVAKREGVTVWLEIEGRRIGISPDIHDTNRKNPVEEDEDFRL